MRVGVVALQGDFEAHQKLLQGLGVEAPLVRSVRDLENLHGVVLPGGESTTQSLLLQRAGLQDALVRRAGEGLGVLGTCAGAILMASKVEGGGVSSLGLLDITIERNAYGRQRESFEMTLLGEKLSFERPAVFIRAPRILRLGDGVEALATMEEGCVLAASQKFVACCFHPELVQEPSIHQFFLKRL